MKKKKNILPERIRTCRLRFSQRKMLSDCKILLFVKSNYARKAMTFMVNLTGHCSYKRLLDQSFIFYLISELFHITNWVFGFYFPYFTWLMSLFKNKWCSWFHDRQIKQVRWEINAIFQTCFPKDCVMMAKPAISLGYCSKYTQTNHLHIRLDLTTSGKQLMVKEEIAWRVLAKMAVWVNAALESSCNHIRITAELQNNHHLELPEL